MKRNTATTKQVLKPILYILLYVLILLLFINFLSRTVSADRGENIPIEKEINANENDRI